MTMSLVKFVFKFLHFLVMALNNITKTIKVLLLKKLFKFLNPHTKLPEMVVPLFGYDVKFSYKQNVNLKKPNISHANVFMQNASVYESLINQSTPQTKFSTKDTTSEHDCEVKANEEKKLPPGRHQFHREIEKLINKQVGEELHAAFSYLSMACYFGRVDVALPGCQGFFINMYEEELGHAMVFINYLLLRGAYVRLSMNDVPECQDLKSIDKAFGIALNMEKDIKEKLICIYNIAEKHNDLEVMDIVTQFMEEQNRSICEMARFLKRAEMAVDPVGEYLFDKLMYNSFVKKSKHNLMFKKKLDSEPESKVYK